MIDLSLDYNVFINSEFDAALQELDLLFNTETTELINNATFGTNFEQFLWQLTPATQSLKQYISEKINETKPSIMYKNMKTEVNAEQLKTIYRIQFSVLQSYEADTWYDANGRIVFTKNRSLIGVGFDRNEWENNIKNAPHYSAHI